MVKHKIDIMLMRMIKNSKGPFAAVLIIIIAGICIFSSMNMAFINLRDTVSIYYEENHFPDLFINAGAVPAQEIDRLSDISGVKRAMGRITIDVPMVTEGSDERVNIRIISIKGGSEELSRYTLLKGRAVSGSGKEAVLIGQFANARNLEVGDEIEIQAHGVRYDLEIVGIAAHPEYIYLMENTQSIMPAEGNFGICFVSESLGQQIAGLKGNYNEILVSYEDGANEDKLIESIEKRLDKYGIRQTLKQKDQLSNSMIQEEISNLERMANSLPIVFLLVAGLILMMMLARMVKKDRIKIGVLKAIGYSNIQVIMHYVKYALLAGFIGGLLGSVSGSLLSAAMTKLYLEFFNIPLLKTEFFFSYFAYSIILSVLFCIVSGVIGARGALKISPADAMREDVPKSGKRILLERAVYVWRRLSFSNKVVARNIFRNKKRTFFILTGVMLTYGMMVFTTSMPDIIDRMIIKHFSEFQKMDYSISFHNPVEKRAINDLKHIIDIEYMEGKIEYPFELSNGNKKQYASIIGLSRDTVFYSFRDNNGNPVRIPDKGILISENLAKSLGAEKGDRIKVKGFKPSRDDVYIEIANVIKQSLGMNAYMDIKSMGRLLLEKNIITGVYLKSDDENINEKLLYASNVATVLSVADIRSSFEQYMQMIFISIGFMVIFSGILGFCIVYNTTIVSIGEREMEFSSLRVLGFGKNEIFQMILKENNIIMIAGILLGIPAGIVFTEYSSAVFSTEMYSMEISPTPASNITAAIFTVIFILLAQLAAYRKINNLDFIQALKNRAS